MFSFFKQNFILIAFEVFCMRATLSASLMFIDFIILPTFNQNYTFEVPYCHFLLHPFTSSVSGPASALITLYFLTRPVGVLPLTPSTKFWVHIENTKRKLSFVLTSFNTRR